MEGTLKLAKVCLNRIVELWQVDANRMSWDRDDDGKCYGFEFWPGDYRVSVRALIAQEDRPYKIKLTVRTDFLQYINPRNEQFESFIGLTARYSTSTYGWVYPPSRILKQLNDLENLQDLWLNGSVYLNEQNAGWLTDFFAKASIIQPINAQIQGEQIASIAGSGVASLNRPQLLRDLPLDDILEVVAQVYAPIGKEKSKFAGHMEFEEFAEKYARSDNCFGNGDPTGMTLETPFGSDSALIRLRTDESHPQLGSGLLATLQLPYTGDFIDIARQAAELNFYETIEWTDFPQLGGWHTAENRGSEDGLAFTLFVPSALYMPFLATNIAFSFLARARWAKNTLYPNLEDLTMLQILERRFSSMRK